MLDDNDRPDKRSSASEAMLAAVELMRDVAEGTDAIRAAKGKYLPQHPAEETIDYNIRLNRTPFFGATDRTTEGLTGFVYRRDIEPDVAPKIEPLLLNIDNADTHIDVFAKTVLRDSLEAGHAGILVDAPLVEGGQVTRSDDELSGVRPYWVHVLKEDIISWRFVQEKGRRVLQQIVLRQPAIEPSGRFGEEKFDRFRVFARTGEGAEAVVSWELWEKREDQGEPVKKTTGTVANVTEIPFAVSYGKRTGELESRPPLLDLAHLNIAHYQTLSDHLHALHKVSFPHLVIEGIRIDEELITGPNSAISLPRGDMEAYFIEPHGAGLQATAAQLKDFEKQMAVLGLGMLQHESRAAETAEAKRIDKSEQDSALAVAARSHQDALATALKFTAQMMQIDDPGTLVVNRDFERLSLDAQELDVYAKLVDSGKLSLVTFWKIMAEGGSLPDDFDPDVELEQIEDEGIPEPAPIQVFEPPEDE